MSGPLLCQHYEPADGSCPKCRRNGQRWRRRFAVGVAARLRAVEYIVHPSHPYMKRQIIAAVLAEFAGRRGAK